MRKDVFCFTWIMIQFYTLLESLLSFPCRRNVYRRDVLESGQSQIINSLTWLNWGDWNFVIPWRFIRGIFSELYLHLAVQEMRSSHEIYSDKKIIDQVNCTKAMSGGYNWRLISPLSWDSSINCFQNWITHRQINEMFQEGHVSNLINYFSKEQSAKISDFGNLTKKSSGGNNLIQHFG